jgi:hypothetical protein
MNEYDMLPEIYMRIVTQTYLAGLEDSEIIKQDCEHMLKVAKIVASVYYKDQDDNSN